MAIKVLITGGAGYLGCVLTHQLLVRGFEVTVLDNFSHGLPSLAHLCAFNKLTIVRANAWEISRKRDLVEGHDVLIPLAALVGAPLCERSPGEAWVTNRDSVRNLVALASPKQVIVYPNTNSGYGRSSESICDENSPLEPLSVYGRSKVEAERFVLDHPFGISLRFATLFGCSPRMRLDLMVNDFVYRALRDKALVIYEGHFRRNFLHVEDAAFAIYHAIMNREAMRGKAFNAGNHSANLTKRGLATLVAQHTGCRVIEEPLGQDPDQRDYIVSSDRLIETGWRPSYNLDEGIEQLIRCFKQPFEGSFRNA